jgi:hypothetical protein
LSRHEQTCDRLVLLDHRDTSPAITALDGAAVDDRPIPSTHATIRCGEGLPISASADSIPRRRQIEAAPAASKSMGLAR